MALELRRTGYTDPHRIRRAAFHVMERETVVGRIYEYASNKWVWTVYISQPRDEAGGLADSLDQARNQFKRAWSATSLKPRTPDTNLTALDCPRVAMQAAHQPVSKTMERDGRETTKPSVVASQDDPSISAFPTS